MRQFRTFSTAFTMLALTACVTINVYFPAVAAEKAADRIIHDVWGERTPPSGTQKNNDADHATDSQSRAIDNAPPLALRMLAFIIAPAHAQQPRIDISSPAIKRLTAAMEQRHQKLLPYYRSGAIGLTRDALIEVRDLGTVALAKRGQVRQLVAAENHDRNALYREIAVANDHPEWEEKIRGVFANRWISNAQGGWYYQNDAGQWVQK